MNTVPVGLVFRGTVIRDASGKWKVRMEMSTTPEVACIVDHPREAFAFIAQRLNAAHPAAQEDEHGT